MRRRTSCRSSTVRSTGMAFRQERTVILDGELKLSYTKLILRPG